MAMKISGASCRVAVSSGKDGDKHVSHLFCESKIYGLRCRLEGLPGKKAYVLCSDCLQPADFRKGGH